MRFVAKASSAGSTQCQATGLGRIFRGALATRGTSIAFDGSGAPSGGRAVLAQGLHRPATLALTTLLLAGFLALAFASSAQAGKAVVKIVGGNLDGVVNSNGTLGGKFNTARGVAVNEAGAGAADPGDFYVVDGANHRVQQFNADGNFIRAFGQDTIAASVNEQQFLSVVATGGTYTLTFNGQTTTPLAFDANSGTIDDALDALSTIGGDANVAVTGFFSSGFTVTFQGTLAAADQSQMTVDTSSLSGEASIETLADGTATTTDTGTGFERCEVAGHCKIGITTAQAGGAFNQPQGIAIDQSDGSLYVTDQGNRRVQKFTADGTFERAWGFDVIQSGKPGDLGTAAFEVCTVAEDCKIAAAAGANAGRFGAAIGHPAVVPAGAPGAGEVLVSDPTNRRVQRFEADGDFLYAFGWNVDPVGGSGELEKCSASCQAGTAGSALGQFPTSQPTRVAADTSGVIYTVESASTFRVQRFNPEITSAGSFSSANFNSTNAPSDVQVNPANDQVFAAKLVGSSPGERRVVQLDFLGNLLDTHAEGAGLPATTGLGLNGSSGRMYLSAGARIFVLDTQTPPLATIDPVTTFDETTATFTGDIDPQGLRTRYRFEYSTDGFKTKTAVPLTDTDAGPIGSNNPVSQSVTGLEPNTTYQVRLVATKPFAAGTTTTASESFTTSATPPRIVRVGTFPSGTDTSAILFATIDPESQQTSFHFEWGTDTSYGQSTPVELVGAGSATQTMLVRLNGLQTGTTYHFKAVATNPSDTVESADTTFTLSASPDCSNDAVRVGPSAGLPDCRAYEMVSPLDKNGGDIDTPEQAAGEGSHFSSAYRQASVEGGRVTYTSATAFGDAIAGHWSNQYISTRGPEGWSTHAINSPRANTMKFGFGFLRWTVYPVFQDFTPDLSSAWFRDDNVEPLTSDALRGHVNLYRRDNGADSLEALTAQGPFGANAAADLSQDGGGNAGGLRMVGHSSDLSHQVFTASAALTPDANQEKKSSFDHGTNTQLYDLLEEPTDAVQRLTVKATAGDYTLSVPVASGSGRLSFASGFADYAKESTTVSAFTGFGFSGAYEVGQTISGPGIPSGTTITAVTGDTLTISAETEAAGFFVTVTAASKEVTDLTTASGGFAAGQAIAGGGIPAGTTIEAAGEGTLTLSQNPTAGGVQALVASETSAPLAATASATEVQAALEAPAGAGNVTVSGGPGDANGSTPYEISFGGELSGKPIFGLTTADLSLSGGTPASSATVAIADPGGPIHLVSVLPDGQASTDDAFAGAAQSNTLIDTKDQMLKNAVSDDGSRIFWTANIGPGKIYLRENPGEAQSPLDGAGECTEPAKACTIRVSESVSPSPAQYWAAAADGSRVLFSQGDFPNRALYLFDVETGTPTQIAGESPGVAATAEDLSHIYFVSREAKAPGAIAGRSNLYDYHEGSYSLVGVVSGDDVTPKSEFFVGSSHFMGNLIGSSVSVGSPPSPILNQTRVSPDGRHFAFMSNSAALAEAAGYDNTDVLTAKPDFQVYRYDADAEELTCASCNPTGARPQGSPVQAPYSPTELTFPKQPNLRAAAMIPTHENDNYASRILSDDGNRLFFHSDEALLPRDTNGIQDVYLWQAPGTGECEVGDSDYFPQNDGCIYLISTGRDDAKSEFVDATPDGSEVYISVDESLDPRDPGLRDIYVAKVGGGYPMPSEDALCEGEACQSPPAPPDDPTPNSLSFQGPGNPTAQGGKPKARRCPKGKRRVKARGGKTRCVKRQRSAKRAKAKRAKRANNNRRASR